VAVAALLTLLFAPSSAAAPAQWTQKAAEIAAPWPGLQLSDGSFRDYVITRDPTGTRDDYGDPILGYGLLLTAARTGDAALADSGLRALEHSLANAARSPSTQVFHQMAVVSAYNLARARFASHPVFIRAREDWEALMRRIEVYRIGRHEVTNKSIVEAVLLLELLGSELSGGQPGSALADRSATRAAVKRFLATDLPRASKPFERSGRAVIGDLPLLPPAYHGLSIGMLARAVDLLGDEAPGAARSLLRRATDASVAATAPDGEVAYHGRSQAQAWAHTLTGYGAELAAAQPGAKSQAAGYRGLSRRVIARVADSYKTGPEGFLVTPSLAQDIEAAIPGIDEYVAGASYVGLTLASLEWAIAAAGDGEAGRIGADRTGGFILGQGTGSWATSRGGDSWFAVKRSRTSVRDLRYDSGLVALKVRRDDGVWGDAMPLRPRTLTGDQSAGPVLNGSGVPEFTELLRGKAGRIVARGGFRTRSGRWLRRGVTFTFTPIDCGLRLTWNASKGDRYAYSGFFRTRPTAGDRSIADATQSIEFDAPVTTSTASGYSSGSDAVLTRAVARSKRSRSGSAAITVCRP
jgi:hypothetical protein